MGSAYCACSKLLLFIFTNLYYVYTRANYYGFISQVTKDWNDHGLHLHWILEISTNLEWKRIKKTRKSFRNDFLAFSFWVLNDLSFCNINSWKRNILEISDILATFWAYHRSPCTGHYHTCKSLNWKQSLLRFHNLV